MVDLVAISIPGASFPLEKIPNLRPFHGGQEGTFQGLHVTQWDEYMVIKGSLAKYLNGENVTPLTREGVNESLSQLERETRLDLSKGRTLKLEFGTTLPVTHKPHEYLDEWGIFGCYKKATWGNGETVQLSLRSSGKAFIGYDKAEQIKPKRLPTTFPGINALRLEMKYTRGVSKIFGRTLSPWDLCMSDIYSGLIEQFKAFYFAIPKRREIRHMAHERFTPSRFCNAMAIVGIETYGFDRALSDISDALKMGQIDKKTAQRTRELIRGLKANERLANASDYSKEVDELVSKICG